MTTECKRHDWAESESSVRVCMGCGEYDEVDGSAEDGELNSGDVCACGKPPAWLMTEWIEGEDAPRTRVPMCVDCGRWVIDGAPTTGHA